MNLLEKLNPMEQLKSVLASGTPESSLGNSTVAGLWENNSPLSQGTMNLTDNISGMNNLNFGALQGVGGGGGGIFGDLFGDSGLLSKDNLAMGSDILGMGTGIMGMYNSYKDRGMMEDMIDYGKDTKNRDLANSAAMVNNQLWEKEQAYNGWGARAGRKPVSFQKADGSAIK